MKRPRPKKFREWRTYQPDDQNAPGFNLEVPGDAKAWTGIRDMYSKPNGDVVIVRCCDTVTLTRYGGIASWEMHGSMSIAMQDMAMKIAKNR